MVLFIAFWNVVLPIILADAPAAVPQGGWTKAELQRRLEAPIDIDVREVPFCQFFDNLGHLAGLPLVLDAEELKNSGIALDEAVGIRLEGISLRSVLRLIAKQCHCGFVVQDESILITSHRKALGANVRRVHPIYDLLTTVEAAGKPWQTEMPEWLARLIEETIEPAVWKGSGDSTIAFNARDRTLDVFAPQDCQEQVTQLLDALRLLPSSMNLDEW